MTGCAIASLSRAGRARPDRLAGRSCANASPVRSAGQSMASTARTMEWKLNGSDIQADLDAHRDIVRTRTEGLFVLPSGALPGNPSAMLASKRFKRLMTALAGTFDRILL